MTTGSGERTDSSFPGRGRERAADIEVSQPGNGPTRALQPRAVLLRYVPVSVTEEGLALDLTAAMKARDAQRVAVLRSVVAAAKHLKVEKRVRELDDAALTQVVRREIRQREEAEEFARKAGRDDLASQNVAERRILEEYVPPPLTPEELEGAVREALAGGTQRQMGPVMAALRERYASRLEGKIASEVARRILAEAAG
jgi:uncharacterized protein YqeY